MAGLAIKIGGDASGFTNTMATVRNAALSNASTIASAFTKAGSVIRADFGKTVADMQKLKTETEKLQAAYKIFQDAGGVRALGIGVAGLFALSKAIDGVGEAAAAARERLADLVKIGGQARDVGVGTTFLQSLTGQAKALGVEVGTLTSMLDKARDASTVSIGEGDKGPSSAIQDRLRQNVKAGNLSGADLDRFTGASSQEARIKVILDLLDQLRAKGANLAALDLGKTMFGGEFETKLRTGVDMIGAMRRALDGLAAGDKGRIIPPEEIERAENLNRRLEDAQRILESGLAPINRDIAFWQQQQLAGWVDIKEQIAGAAQMAGKLYEWVSGVGKVLSNLGSSNVFATLRDYADKAGFLDKGEQARIERMLNGGLEADSKPAVPKDASDGGPLTITVKPKADTSKSLPSLNVPKAKSSAAPSASEISAIETFVGSLEKSAAALKAEADAYGKSAVERRIAIELAKAEEIAKQNNTKLTEEQTKRIREAATAVAEQRDKIEDLRDAQDTLRSTGRDVFSGLYQDVRHGASALDVLYNGLGRIIDRIASSQIDGFVDKLFGKSGGSGFLSSLFGIGGGGGGSSEAFIGEGLMSTPMYHGGGIVGRPGTGTKAVHPGIFTGAPKFHTGLTASEFPAILERGERVLTERQDQRVSTAMAGLSQAAAARPAPAQRQGPESVALTVDVRGATGNAEVQKMVSQGVQAGMRAVTTQIGRNIGPMIKEHQSRF